MLDTTPMMRQYKELKKAHPNEILFFRLGDFYEMFFDDAQTASRVLHLTLTSREGGQGHRVPMAGIPYHMADNYIARLVKNGFSIAICDQTEDPAVAKGLVKREIVRVITPGTILSETLLEHKVNNYLVGLICSESQIGVAWADVSTGEFKAFEISTENRALIVTAEISKFNPSEILFPMNSSFQKDLESMVKTASNAKLTKWEDWKFNFDDTQQALKDHFQVQTLEGMGLSAHRLAIQAAGAVLKYLKETTHSDLAHINTLILDHPGEGMILDTATQRNLEILKTMRDDEKQGSLLSVMDQTITSMGGRELRRWLVNPLTTVPQIRERQDAIEEGLIQRDSREQIRKIFKEIADLERLIGRIGCASANARDLIALRNTIRYFPALQVIQAGFKSDLLRRQFETWDNLKEVLQLLEQSLMDEPPLTLKEGGLIKPGYHDELDRLRKDAHEGKSFITTLEGKERQRTGIHSLKVRYTSVFGYYIEVSKTHLNKIPPDYFRKQTLVNADRFVTAELKEAEGKVLGAQDRADQLEYEIFQAIRSQISKDMARIQRMARHLAGLDVYMSLADLAEKNHYSRPEIENTSELMIEEGKHPVLSQLIATDQFIPNDTCLGSEEARIMLLTGPNMAGKSTYIRQVALLVLMAQMGSFVPAKYMKLGLVDRIFSRVGASDNLVQGQSTFMVEMIETANILNYATNKSLVILDEIGRGTSTYDGIAIAWAVVEYLSQNIQARTLFATHYHELTQLSKEFKNIKNFNVAVREWNDQILFLRKIVEGGTDKSYGIHVARLAGVPKWVIERSKKILILLESTNSLASQLEQKDREVTNLEEPEVKRSQLPLFESKMQHPIIQELERIQINEITPLMALNLIEQWKSKIWDFKNDA
jgi:DNA mismatch repair protein MutS